MEHFVSSIESHVAAGAGLLDRYVPGWIDSINLDRFDIRNETGCVLAQAMGVIYSNAIERLREKGAGHLNMDNAYKFGFNYCGDYDPAQYQHAYYERPEAVEKEWKRVIENRRIAESDVALADLRARLTDTDPVASVVFTLRDGTTVGFENVNVDSVGPSAVSPGVIGVEFTDDTDRIVHVPFVSHWEFSY